MTNIKDEAFAAYLAASRQDLDLPNLDLLVNYLPNNMLESELACLFSDFGALESVRIVKNKQTGVYGFVKFEKFNDAIAAQFQLDGHLVSGKSLKVSFAHSGSNEAKNTTLYVANLPLDYNKKKVSFLFQRFGAIKGVRVLPQKPIGVLSAFVEFYKIASAEAAKKNMLHKRLPGSQKPLVIRPASLRTKN